MFSVIDLYAGAGGLSLGAARAGFNLVAAVELDPNAMKSHITNFPNTIHIQKDISTLTGRELLTLAKKPDSDTLGIIGGPPCQGFSSMGHGDVNDDRNSLFIKFFQIVFKRSEIRSVRTPDLSINTRHAESDRFINTLSSYFTSFIKLCIIHG